VVIWLRGMKGNIWHRGQEVNLAYRIEGQCGTKESVVI